MIPSRRQLRDRLVPDEDLRSVTYGRLVDDSIRGTVAIGLTDRRVVCLSTAGDLVDVDYATISTIRSFTRSRLTFEGVDPRLLTGGFGVLAALFVALSAALVAAPWNGDSLVATALVGLTALAALVAIFGRRFLHLSGLRVVVRWIWGMVASIVALLHGIVRSSWTVCVWCAKQGRRTYRWSRNRTFGLSRWSVDRLRRVYWWSGSRLSTLYRWSAERVCALPRWFRAGIDAIYLQYAVRTDRPLAPVGRRLEKAGRSGVVRWLAASIRRLGHGTRRAVVGAGNAILAGLAWLRGWHVGRRMRALVRPLRSSIAALAYSFRSRISAVTRPRLPRLSFRPGSRSSSTDGRRWPRLLAAAVTVGSFLALVTLGPAPLVTVTLAAAIGCLAVVAYATRIENDCTGVQFSRQQETELSIHTVDGDTVRILLDPETDLDTELSRSAAAVARTTPDAPTTGSVAE